ncbi:MAG: response regulator [Desulfovibrionales bacterium]|nr:response regulator [Desulfovibrionales bacterium]
MSDLESCRVLFVDDEEEFLSTLVKYLRRKKLNVTAAHSGLAGLEWFQNNDVDVVVLDIKMPDMSGLEVLAKMRELKGDDFSVIILSGHAHTDLAIAAMRGGASDFLLKPCELNELLERIDLAYERLMERKGGQAATHEITT